MDTKKLTNLNISSDIENLSSYYKNNKIDKTVALQNTLAFEEILLKYQEHFGEDTEYSMSVRRWLGVHKSKITVIGDSFDPLNGENEDDDDFLINRVMTSMGMMPRYSYRRGCNTVVLQTKKHTLSPAASLIITVIVSVICAMLSRLLPENVASFISNEIVSPILNVFTGLLNAVVGPTIFLTVLVSMVNLGDISTLKQTGTKAIRTIMRALVLFSAVSVLIPILLVETGGGVEADSPFYIIRDTILSIIPSNLVGPFSEGNILQILFLSIIIALAILATCDQDCGLIGGLNSLNNAFLNILERVTLLLPIFIFSSIYLLLSDETASFSGLGYCAFFYLIGQTVFLAVSFLTTWYICKISPQKIFKYSFHTISKASLTCSSILALAPNLKDLADENKYGFDENDVKFVYPLGQILYRPSSVVSYFAVILGIMVISGTDIPVTSIVTLGIISLIFSIATPPSAGGGIAIITLLFGIFHLDARYLALAIAADTVLDYITSGMNAFGFLDCTLLCLGKKTERDKSGKKG